MRESVSVVTAWDEKSDPLGQFVWPNREGYCHRHGYNRRGGLTVGDGVWVKPAAISEAMSGGDSWVAWFDADVLITNPESPLDWLDSTSADLIFSCDCHGMNNGVLFVRNTPWSSGLIDRWLSVRGHYHQYPSADQVALAHILLGEPKEKWECLPQRTFNSYLYGEYGLTHPDGEWQIGDFALHLPGLPDSRRLEIFEQFAK